VRVDITTQEVLRSGARSATHTEVPIASGGGDVRFAPRLGDHTDALDPFSISDDAAAAILGIEVADVYRGGGYIVSTRSDPIGLQLTVDPATSLTDAAAVLRYPQFLSQLSDPAVGGGFTGSLEGTSVIVWSHRGVNWTLQGRTDLDTLANTVEKAQAVIDAIDE
jgi:hypothetical protein